MRAGPGIFNERADWADILLPLGAVLHHEADGERYWTRPGKDPRNGHSATTGYADEADRLKVFTPHWPPFADGEIYTKFGAYALLNHGGDYQAAARELSRLGYGSRQSAQAPPAGSALNEPPEMGPHPADQPQIDGSSTLAPVVKLKGRQRPEPLTELGFARRLVDKHGDELRYVVPWNRWLIWDGARWAPDTDGHVPRCMKVIAREVHTALIRANAASDVIRAAKRAESSSAIKGAPGASTGARTGWPSPGRSPRRPRPTAPRATRSAGS